jgi:cellulose synthase/poly-beta-1,6-N-acetylglucosamine synthase-like glycosyltransferase
MKSASIIIPAWNEAKTIKKTLEALLKIDYDMDQCEIIIVAGGDDGTFSLAKSLALQGEAFSRYVILEQGPLGKNAAIQQGVRKAGNPIIVLLDADTIVSPGWLKAMVHPIERGDTHLTIANPEPVRKTWVSDYYTINKLYFMDHIVTYSGHAMAFRAEVVRDHLDYFFDESVKVGVDYLLAKRFLERGLGVTFAKDALVTTHIPSTFRYFWLSELRWMAALINIDDVSYTNLGRNVAIVAAMVCVVPVFEKVSVLSLLFNLVYMIRKARIFFAVRTEYHAGIKSLLGFIFLSYAYHLIGIISYLRHFLGLSRNTYLYQGERY